MQKKSSYLKTVKKIKKMLRRSFLNRYTVSRKIITLAFDKSFWQPTQRSIIYGATIGMFFTCLPIPLQMVAAILTCLPLKGNIPISTAICWLTNPFTIAPYFVFAHQLGKYLATITHLQLPKWDIDLNLLSKLLSSEAIINFNVSALIIGCVICAIVCSTFTFIILQCYFKYVANNNQASNHRD